MKKYSSLLFIAILFIFSACGSDMQRGTGSASFKVVWKDISASDMSLQTISKSSAGQGFSPAYAPLDCTTIGVDTVQAIVYDTSDSSVATGGPWNCSAHSGTITNIPAGSSRKFVILGKDSSGNIKYRGETTGVTITSGQTTDVGTIIATYFIPTITSPSNDSTLTSSGFSFSWTGTGSSYDIQVSAGSSFTSTVINTTVSSGSYTSTATLSDGTYYWRVRANSRGNTSGWTSPYSFTVSSAQSAGGWEPTGAMNQERIWHVAILLSNGKVLIAGGGINPQPRGRGDYFNTAELYDPTNGTFTYTGSMNVKRGWHTPPGGAVLLNNGKVLVVGGYYDDGTQLISNKSAELFDPSTGGFSYTGSMNNISGGHVKAILLQSGKVLVTGFSYAEIYDPSTGAFSPTGNPIYSRLIHTATLLSNGNVLVTGGHTGTVALSTTEVYDPVTGTFSQTGNMKYPRWQHTATLLLDGRVLITGGTSSNSMDWQQMEDASRLSSAEIYDPSTGIFSLTGSMGYPRTGHTATLLSNGNVLIAGGYGGSSIGNVANAELYDPSTGKFRIGSSMVTQRSNHSATLLSSGKVLVAGMSRASELFTPP